MHSNRDVRFSNWPFGVKRFQTGSDLFSPESVISLFLHCQLRKKIRSHCRRYQATMCREKLSMTAEDGCVYRFSGLKLALVGNSKLGVKEIFDKLRRVEPTLR